MSMFATLAQLAGGVGLFLLGMWLMTDGMKSAAGPALQRILANATRTRWRALASGMLVTAVVQSSSAVTVAAIGFVNAGLLTLGQTLWVLFGANVGTTMTGWLVAAAGMGFKVEAAALPLVGAGMLLHLTGQGTRRAALGLTLAGFGTLFLGIDILKTAFSGVASQYALPSAGGAAGIALHVGAGLILTILMQSSSAALAVALTAAQGGLLALEPAAAVVIGANLGTTATAIIAAAGATVAARRAAAAHVLFNLVTGAVALLILPWLLRAVMALRDAFAMEQSAATVLALFHTAFNLLGVLLMWPLANRLTVFLEARFSRAADDLARPRHLDRNLMALPGMAVPALARELAHMRELAVGLLRAVMQGQQKEEATRRFDAADALRVEIDSFVSGLDRAAMRADTAQELTLLLRVLRYYVSVAQAAQTLGARNTLASAVADGRQDVRRWLEQADLLCAHALSGEAAAVDTLESMSSATEAGYQELKAGLLQAGAAGSLDLACMEALLEACSLVRRGLQQTVKAARVLAGGPARA